MLNPLSEKLIKFLKSEYFIFVFARAIIVITKPIFLWLCISYSFDYTAKNISLWYLVLASLMVIFNNEAHFSFYKELFNKNSHSFKIVRKEIEYYQQLAIHIFLFLLPVSILTLIITESLLLSLLFLVFILLEKIVDEIQRIRQFKKKFKEWSILMMIKGVLPFLFAILVMYTTYNDKLVLFSYFLALGFAVTYICYTYTKKSYWLIAYTHLKQFSGLKFRNYITAYKQKMFHNQLQSFSSRNVPILDRYIVRFLDAHLLPVFTLLSQIGSFSVLFIDYFLISHRRNEYIEKSQNVRHIISLPTLFFFFVLSFIVFAGAAFLLNFFGHMKELNIKMEYVYGIGLYFSLFSISQHFNQFNFWNRKRIYTLSIDFIFYILVISMVFTFYSSKGIIEAVIYSMLIGQMTRILLQVILALNKQEKYKYIS